MKINFVDIGIIIILIVGFINGYKRGLFKQGLMTIGTVASIICAFLFKNNLSIFLYTKLPFLSTGLLMNYSALNIFFYELVSFLILLSVFSIIYGIILKIFKVFKKMLDDEDNVLRIPFKILGGLLGVVENYIFCFIVLLIITMPIFSFSNDKIITESKLKDKILVKTLVLSNVSKGIVSSINEVNDLIRNGDDIGTEEFNCKTLDILKKNKIVTKESLKYLKDSKKMDFECGKNEKE